MLTIAVKCDLGRGVSTFYLGFIVEVTTRVHFRACYNPRKYFPSFRVLKKNHKQSISSLHFPYLDLN